MVSDQVVRYVQEDAVAVDASESRRVPVLYEELGGDGLSLVRYAVGVAASYQTDDLVAQFHVEFLRHIVVADDGYRRLGGDEGYLGDGGLVELHVLEFHDVLPLLAFLRGGDVHPYADPGVDVVLVDSEDLQHVECLSVLDMVDDGAVPYRRDLDLGYLLHMSPPRMAQRMAILTGTPLNACWKYLAWGVESTSVAISFTLGRGCMTIMSSLAFLSIALSIL